MVGVIYGQPRENNNANFWGGVGQGLGKSIENYSNLSLQQKMSALEDKRALDQYQKMSYLKMQQEMKENSMVANKLRSQGYHTAADITESFGHKSLPHFFGEVDLFSKDKSGLEGAMQALQGLGPQRQMEAPENELIPYQDREAVEEPQEMPQVQRTQPMTSTMMPQTEKPSGEGLKKFNDFYNEELNKYPNTRKGRESARVSANTKFQAAVKEKEFGATEQKNIRESEEHEKRMEEKPSKYIEEVEKKFSGWKKQKPNYSFMSKNASKITDKSSLKKAISEKFGIPSGLILSDPEQAMDKFANAILQGVSQAYPGQLKVAELDNFIKSNPSLLNSPQAIKHLSDVALKVGELTEQEYKETQKIRNEYRSRKERLPENFNALVEERLQPKFDELDKDIDKIMSEKLPNEFKKWQPKEKFSGKKIRIQRSDGTVGEIPEELKEAFIKKGYKIQ